MGGLRAPGTPTTTVKTDMVRTDLRAGANPTIAHTLMRAHRTPCARRADVPSVRFRCTWAQLLEFDGMPFLDGKLMRKHAGRTSSGRTGSVPYMWRTCGRVFARGRRGQLPGAKNSGI